MLQMILNRAKMLNVPVIAIAVVNSTKLINSVCSHWSKKNLPMFVYHSTVVCRVHAYTVHRTHLNLLYSYWVFKQAIFNQLAFQNFLFDVFENALSDVEDV